MTTKGTDGNRSKNDWKPRWYILKRWFWISFLKRCPFCKHKIDWGWEYDDTPYGMVQRWKHWTCDKDECWKTHNCDEELYYL